MRVAICVIWDVKIVSTTKRGAIACCSVDALEEATEMGQFDWFNMDFVCQGEKKVFWVISVSFWTTYMTKNKAKQKTIFTWLPLRGLEPETTYTNIEYWKERKRRRCLLFISPWWWHHLDICFSKTKWVSHQRWTVKLRKSQSLPFIEKASQRGHAYQLRKGHLMRKLLVVITIELMTLNGDLTLQLWLDKS